MDLVSTRLHVFLLALLLSAFGVQSAAAQATITVDGIGDDVSVNGSCSIREAVQNTNDDADTNVDCTAAGAYNNADIINITSANVTVNDGQIVITDGVTINGAPTAITASSLSRHFTASAGTDDVTFNDLTLTDGVEGAAGGGAIFTVTGTGTVTIMNSTLSGNTATTGGAIQNNAPLVLDNTEVSNNTADESGGGIFNGTGTLTVQNGSVINGNTASGAAATNGGGGIYNSLANPVTITGATTGITNNVADGTSGSGGGIFSADGLVTITDATIDLNTANRAGGGIEVRAGTVNLTNVVLGTAGNGNSTGAAPGNGGGLHVSTTATVTVDGGSVEGNTAAAEGGGLWNSLGGTMTVQNGTLIDGNTASGVAADQGGGGLFNDGGTLTITSAATTISNNMADGAAGSGGGILNDGGTLNITDATIETNTAVRAGGGIEVTTANSRDSNAMLTTVMIDGNMTGAAPGNGGGVHITDTPGGNVSIFTMDGGSVTNNTAASEGGGLWNGAGTMTIQNGTLIDTNTASGNSGDNGGGGVFNNGGTLTISSSTISNNIADGTLGSGGGIFNETGGTLTVTDTEVTFNQAERAGGGIEDNSGAGLGVTLTNVTLDENAANGTDVTAPGNGGGLHVTGAGGVLIDGGTVNTNTAALEGGGLWNGTGTMTLQNGTIIDGNTASGDGSDDGGGGIFNNSGTVMVIGAATMITNNDADGILGSGGGILNNGASAILNVTDATISGNIANRAGGGIEDNGGTVNLTNVLLEANNVGMAPAVPAPGNGGGLHSGGGVVTVDGGEVTGNVAVEGGGLWTSNMLTVQNSTLIDGNTGNGTDAEQSGGGIFIEAGIASITDATVSNNIALGDDPGEGGGGIFNDGAITITNTEISGNTATNGLGNGGGILNSDGGTLDITGGSITGNEAARAGGGIENNGSPLTLTGVMLDGNTTGINGGGLHISGAGVVTIDGGTASGNTAGQEGGGLWNSAGGTLTVLNGIVIDGNTANAGNNGGNDQGGGGIFNDGGTLDIDEATISNNMALLNAGNGGGVMTVGGTVTIDNSTITGNQVARAGGGIENNNGAVTITTVTLDGNMTGINGGALHISGAGTVDIDVSTVSNNTADNEGGGLWNSTGGTITVLNSTISSNSAPFGGGIFGDGAGGTVMLDFVTVANNTATTQGGGIVNEDNTVTFRNTLLGDNTAPAGPDCFGTLDSNNFNLIENTADCTFVGITANNVTGQDPMLGSLADNGGPTLTHALLSGSPAIDQGECSVSVTTDQRGSPRPSPATGECDMGSIENQNQVDLAINKDDGDARANQGKTITYTLSYINNGLADAMGVTITDVVPANTTFNAAASTGGWSCSDGAGAGTTCTYNLGTLDALDTGSITFAVTVNTGLDSDIMEISNTASISDDGGFGGDLNSDDNSDSDTTPINRADLSLDKRTTAVSQTTNPNGSRTYTGTFLVTVTNSGPNAASGVVVSESFAPGVIPGAGIPSQGSYNAATGVWSVGSIAVDGNATLQVTISATFDADEDNTAIFNIAEITAADQIDPDSQTSDGTGDDFDGSTFVRDELEVPNFMADLSLSKTVDDDGPTSGGTVIFTLTVTNDGPQTTAGVEVTDLLPSGLTFSTASFSDDTDTYDPATGVWAIGALVNGASATLDLTVTVDGSGDITNTAEITRSTLPDPDSQTDNSEGNEDDQVSVTLTVSSASEKDTSTDAETTAGVPTAFELGHNYPNPFNPETVIPYAVPEASHVTLAIYDLLGRQVSVLLDGPVSAGRYEVTWQAQNRPTGVYLVRFQAGSVIKTQRITLMK